MGKFFVFCSFWSFLYYNSFCSLDSSRKLLP